MALYRAVRNRLGDCADYKKLLGSIIEINSFTRNPDGISQNVSSIKQMFSDFEVRVAEHIFNDQAGVPF